MYSFLKDAITALSGVFQTGWWFFFEYLHIIICISKPGICLTSSVGNRYMKKYYLIFKISAILSHLLIFCIWTFSANTYNPKLLAIFFSNWQFFLDSKSCQSSLHRTDGMDISQDRSWISFCYSKEKMALVYSFYDSRSCASYNV